jgi:hypothetical protein
MDRQSQIQHAMQEMQNLKMGGGDDEIVFETPEKVVALISGYLCKCHYENFSLVSDSQFII